MASGVTPPPVKLAATKVRRIGTRTAVRKAAEGCADLLLEWFGEHERAFPWRNSTSHFELLVAEILLRQTNSRTVPIVLGSVMARFPRPVDFGSADEEELTGVIGRLGLGHQRAKQLKSLGQCIVSQHRGRVPRSRTALSRLPGVGPYTAGVVAGAISGKTEAAVDANVARVLCRVQGIVPSHAEPRKSANVWDAAQALALARPNSGARITWAIVDLAAAICTPEKPSCLECPLRPCCVCGSGSGCPSSHPGTIRAIGTAAV